MFADFFDVGVVLHGAVLKQAIGRSGDVGIGNDARRDGVRFGQPRGAVGVILAEFVVLRGSQIAGLDYAGSVDIGIVVDPLVEGVLRVVADEDELLAGCVGQFSV